MKFYFTGDTHGDFKRFENLDIAHNVNSAIIVGGDSGINFFTARRNNLLKQKISETTDCMWYIYCGNHDRRPQNVKGMETVYDIDVGGEVYMEPAFPKIRYFKDFGIYKINGYDCAIIGHAYSVDKYYRLEHSWTWFDDEQLTPTEMEECYELLKDKKFDFIFTHTLPMENRPLDTFLRGVNQLSVDTSMEQFLSKIKNSVNYEVWCAGHYHIDRLQAPYMEIYFEDVESLDEIMERWMRYRKTGELDWWLQKNPYENFFK